MAWRWETEHAFCLQPISQYGRSTHVTQAIACLSICFFLEKENPVWKDIYFAWRMNTLT